MFWLDMGAPSGSGRGYRHPHVVIQNDLFCASKAGTVIVCEIISNLSRADIPGNVRLEKGEAGLPKERSERLSEALEGLDLWLQPRSTPRVI